MSKTEFTIKRNGKDLTLKVRNLTPEIRLESNKYWSAAFSQAIDARYLLRVEAENILKTKGLLDTDKDDAKVELLRKEIKDLEIELRKGRVGSRRMSKQEGRVIALKIKKLRSEISNVGSGVSDFYNSTAENYADNERLQYYIYATTVMADTGDRYWRSFEAFKTAPDEDAEVIRQASRLLLANLTGTNVDYEKNLYENQWLIRMGYMNEQLQLVNDKNQPVDEDGRLINSDGRFINESGQFVDIYGNLVDKDGVLLVEDGWATVDPVASEPHLLQSETVKST